MKVSKLNSFSVVLNIIPNSSNISTIVLFASEKISTVKTKIKTLCGMKDKTFQ